MIGIKVWIPDVWTQVLSISPAFTLSLQYIYWWICCSHWLFSCSSRAIQILYLRCSQCFCPCKRKGCSEFKFTSWMMDTRWLKSCCLGNKVLLSLKPWSKRTAISVTPSLSQCVYTKVLVMHITDVWVISFNQWRSAYFRLKISLGQSCAPISSIIRENREQSASPCHSVSADSLGSRCNVRNLHDVILLSGGPAGPIMLWQQK